MKMSQYHNIHLSAVQDIHVNHQLVNFQQKKKYTATTSSLKQTKVCEPPHVKT